jgi:hypothetical protein
LSRLGKCELIWSSVEIRVTYTASLQIAIRVSRLACRVDNARCAIDNAIRPVAAPIDRTRARNAHPFRSSFRQEVLSSRNATRTTFTFLPCSVIIHLESGMDLALRSAPAPELWSCDYYLNIREPSCQFVKLEWEVGKNRCVLVVFCNTPRSIHSIAGVPFRLTW